MRTLVMASLLLFVGWVGCGNNDSVCRGSSTPQAQSCAPGVVADHSCTDSAGNVYICRNGSGYCRVCSGGSFSDGCKLGGGTGTEAYCVHDCDNC
jgi:hypothetical protein